MDVYRSFNAFLLKEKFYLEAIENIEKQIVGYISLKQDQGKHKSILSLIILRLKLGDWVKAVETQEKYSNDNSYPNSDEYYCAQSLLDAYEKNSEEDLQKALKSQKIKLLENQIAKVGMSLKVSDDPSTKEKRSQKKVTDEKKKELFGSSDDEKISDDELNENVEKKDDLLGDDNVQ